MFVEFECGEDWADSKEQLAENVNGITGKTLIMAISDHLKSKGDQVDEVIAEDYGWCFYTIHRETRYLITASMEPDGTEYYWGVVGVEKCRGLIEKIMGKNKMESRDPVKAFVHDFLEKDLYIVVSGNGWDGK